MNKIKHQITVINLIKQIFKKIDSFYGNNYKFHVPKCDYFNIYIILVFIVCLFILIYI
jgi:Mg2+ and Co2+ transporter CorA